MINTRKFFRLKNNEHLPVIVLAITIIFIIHLCNKHDEKTANQYIMEDNEKENHQLCPLYPSTLQSMCRIKHDLHFHNYLLLLFVLDSVPLDMSSNLEWTDIEQHAKHVQTGRNRDCYIRSLNSESFPHILTTYCTIRKHFLVFFLSGTSRKYVMSCL